MKNRTVTVTTDRRQEIETLLRHLPAILAGNEYDKHGIARALKSLVAQTMFSLVAPNFARLGRGEAGADGDRWAELSPQYLAYQRPVVGRKPPKAGKAAPGGKDGFLTPELLKLWRRTYSDRFAFYVMREPDDVAKQHAAAIAWIVVKEAGAKTKLKEFGGRKPGVDYTILKDTGLLQQSLMPGTVSASGEISANYQPEPNQLYEQGNARVIVGTKVKYARYHHHAKSGRRRRRLWPERFPADWWRQINEQLVAGIMRIGDLFE